MVTRTVSTIKYVVLVAFSAVIVIGSASAYAEPGSWDIEDFDSCTALLDDGINESLQQKLDEARYCCEHTGGVWNEGQQACQAPPAQEAQAPRLPRPLRPVGPVEETKVAVEPTTTTTVRPLPTLPGVIPPRQSG